MDTASYMVTTDYSPLEYTPITYGHGPKHTPDYCTHDTPDP